MKDPASGDAMLRMIEMAMSKPAGTVTHVDIIHDEWCESHITALDADCDCEPEVVERRVN